MDVTAAAASFIDANWQGLIAIVALVVAVRAYFLQRRVATVEHFAHVVDFGPLPDEVPIPSGEGMFRIKVQLSNPTGSPQIIRDLWLRPLEFDALDDQQAERLVRFFQMLGSFARDYFAQPAAKAKFMEAGTGPPVPGQGIIEVLAGLLNIVDRLTTGKITVRGRVRYLEFAFNAMLSDLGQLAKPKSNSEIRAWADLILTERDPIDLVAPEERMPVTRSVNVEIRPKGVCEIEVDFSEFSETCHRALQFIGGKFSFNCVLEARVRHGEDDVQSDLFELKVEVVPLDLDVFATSIRRAFDQESGKESG
jgi:hypothetical protein